MVNLKQVILSFILPIIVTIIIPFIILVFIENRSVVNLINENLGFLILGIIFIGLGLILFIDCNWLFYKIGKGTLMGLPKMQTQSLIIVGPYKYVRNPMYISVVAIVIGEILIFGSWMLLIWVIGFWIMFNIYLLVAEEVGLEKRFGDEFIRYKQNVRSWIPRFKPYNPDEKVSLVK